MSRQVKGWLALVVGATLALTSCASDNEASETPSPSAISSSEDFAQEPTPSEEPLPTDPSSVLPNFEDFEACGRPCWLPINPEAEAIHGLAITNEWPWERYGSKPGDSLTVACTVEGTSTQNDDVESSTLWYKVIVPADKLTIVDEINDGLTADDLERTPDGDYYGYASTVWLPLAEGVVEPCN